MMTKRQRGLVLLAAFALLGIGTGICNQVASSRVDDHVGEKEASVRAALNSLGSAPSDGFDPEHSLVVRYGLESISGGNPEGTVFATGEVRWAWEYRCVVGKRLASGTVETRVVKRACSEVDPRTVFKPSRY